MLKTIFIYKLQNNYSFFIIKKHSLKLPKSSMKTKKGDIKDHPKRCSYRDHASVYQLRIFWTS